MEKEEQPARLNPAAAIAMTRRMINPSLLLRQTATIPTATIGASAQSRNREEVHR
jgi:hypothetical protein